MTEQVVWRLKRVTLAIPVPSVAAIRARAWMVGPPLLLGLLGAFIATQLQTPSWRSKAEVGIRVSELAPGSATPPTVLVDFFGDRYPRRYLDAQARLARSPQIAARVVRAAGVPDLSAAQFLRHSSAKLVSDTDILTLSVTYRRRAPAVRLANAYASEFTRYKNELDIRQVQDLLHRLRARIMRLRARGQTVAPVHEALVQQLSDLRDVRVQLVTRSGLEEGERRFLVPAARAP